MAADWIVGLLLVAALAVASCSMMGLGVVGALIGGRIARCDRCGRLGMTQGAGRVHDGGCPHPHGPWAHRHHLPLHR